MAIDDDLIKNGITLATKFLDLVTNIVDKMGLIPTLVTGIGAALSLKNVGRDIMYSLFEYADNIHNLLWIQRFRVCYS